MKTLLCNIYILTTDTMFPKIPAFWLTIIDQPMQSFENDLTYVYDLFEAYLMGPIVTYDRFGFKCSNLISQVRRFKFVS